MRRDTWWVLVAGVGLESHPHEQPASVTVAIALVVRGGASPARPPQRSPARRCKWRVAAGIVAAVVGGVVGGEGRRCGGRGGGGGRGRSGARDVVCFGKKSHAAAD